MTSGFRKAVFFIALLGVAIVGYRCMIKPANKSLAEQNQQLQAKLAKLAEFEKNAAAAKNITNQLEQLQGAIQFFESKLPPKSEIEKVLEDITVIAQNQGLRSKRIRALKTKDNSGYIEQPLSMQLAGNFNSFYSLLLELEKLPRIMKIRELKLDKQQKLQGQIAADLVLSVFFQNKNT